MLSTISTTNSTLTEEQMSQSLALKLTGAISEENRAFMQNNLRPEVNIITTLLTKTTQAKEDNDNINITEEKDLYYYKYKPIKETDFYIVCRNQMFNFISCVPAYERVDIQVDKDRVLRVYVDQPESVTRIIGSLLAKANEEYSHVINLEEELLNRGYKLGKIVVLEGVIPVEEVIYSNSEVVVEYEITKNIVSSTKGLSVGERLTLVRINKEYQILLSTTRGVEKLSVVPSDTLFDKITQMAEEHRADGIVLRV